MILTLKPELLSQPNIPKPLHGLNPREIMGQKWWDNERAKVYASTDHHCIACGISKALARSRHWMEAHENWKIDYDTGIAEFIEIVPLCHFCHNFIHSGRLEHIAGKDKPLVEVRAILEHGFKILSVNGLECFPFTLAFAKKLKAYTYGVQSYEIRTDIPWGQWVMKWGDTIYTSKFKNEDEWRKAYE